MTEYEEPSDSLQRQRVQPTELTVQWKHNKEKIGLTRDWKLDEVSSSSNYYTSFNYCVKDDIKKRRATIYQMQNRAVQDTPKLKYGN